MDIVLVYFVSFKYEMVAKEWYDLIFFVICVFCILLSKIVFLFIILYLC